MADRLDVDTRREAVAERDLSVVEAPPGPAPETPEEPIWRIRLRLLRRSLVDNWRLFAENKIGLLGLGIILVFAVMAISHPILMETVWEGQERIYHPLLGYDAVVVEKTIVEEVNDPTTEIDLASARLRLNPFVDVGDTVRIPQQPAPPSRQHLLGTDPRGGDVFSQLLYSTRAAFLMGVIAAIVTVVLATTVGSLAAYYGKWVDSYLMRQADLVLLVPLIPTLIVVSALFTITLPKLGLLIGLLNGFGGTAIVLKSQALAVKVKPFIDAAKVAGGSSWRIIFRHIMPNVLPLSFLYMMFTVTEAISLEAVLSFFGLLNIPMSWGIMINLAQSQGYFLSGTDYWWLLLPPGLAVTLLAAAFFLVGRAMDEVINPRLRQR
ncbi:MAG: ABC transporter permease subunit [Actinomycetota bacterium]|nr:ABC transporter permease subunit [Actinomycetota bacterium]